MFGIRRKSALERSLPDSVRTVIATYVKRVATLDKQYGKKSAVDWAHLAVDVLRYENSASIQNGDTLQAYIEDTFGRNPDYITKDLLFEFAEAVTAASRDIGPKPL